MPSQSSESDLEVFWPQDNLSIGLGFILMPIQLHSEKMHGFLSIPNNYFAFQRECRMFKRIAFAFLSSAALAQSAMAAADGAYIGGGPGMGLMILKNTTTGATSAYASPAGRLLAGYQFNKNFALEAEVFDLGTFSDPSGDVKASGNGLAGVGILPLGSGTFSLFWKVGLTSVTTNATAKPGFVLAGPASQTKSGIGLGFGMNYEFAPKATLRVSLDSYEYGVENNHISGRMTMWGVSGIFHF
jgi:Outer membrane protein beta-barrel domain